jgi:L-xylulokinase
MLSLDSRAGAIAAAWTTGPVAARALALTGQLPHTSAPSALLAWIRDHDPGRYSRIATAFACKDWLRFCLTGAIATDRTEASTSFTDVRTQAWSPDALRLFGLDALAPALPPIAHPGSIAGRVTPEAAALTGLTAGTPVAAGLLDVTASALGIGGHVEGVLAIVAGTYSINETVSPRPLTDPRWFCRNAIEPGRWNAMAISPASAANYDWFLDTLCRAEQQAAGPDVHAFLATEIDSALARPSTALFHPYLFGSPHGPTASAGFLGLRAWHDRGTLLRAVLEGIAFNHRVHADALRDGFPIREARLTGGASRNPAVAQLFADILAMPVTVTDTDEAAAWGAALCAGAAVGLFPSALADPRNPAGTTYDPDPARSAAYETRYRLHCRLAETLTPLWPEIEALARPPA